MKRALCLDLETSGLDATKDKIVEIGMVLFSLEHHTILKCMSSLVNAGVGNAAEEANGIPASALDDGISVSNAIKHFDAWRDSADVVLIHNARFDRSFLPAETASHAPFVCTMDDVSWPLRCSSKSLTSIALAHGLGISHAHRALTDAMTIARLLERSHEMGADLEAMLRRAMRPKVKLIVVDTGFSKERNEQAKQAGFSFDYPTKQWHRTAFIEDLPLMNLPFAITQVAS